MFGAFKIQEKTIKQLISNRTVLDNDAVRANGYNKNLYQEVDYYSQDFKNMISGNINGSELQELCFPVNRIASNFDIFISHSHKDFDDVVLFSGWLKLTYNINCFIDACYWQYANKLLRKINDIHSKNREINGITYFDYSKCNDNASHVYAMLSMAILEMMDSVSYVFFIESDNSLLSSNGGSLITHSPWIYEEINYANHLKPKMSDAFLDEAETRCFSFTPSYDIKLKKFKELVRRDLVLQERTKTNFMNNLKKQFVQYNRNSNNIF